MRIVDPSPSGWAYGFPKECPEEVTDLLEWALSEGYPDDLAKFCVFRVWYTEDIPG